MLIDKLPMVTGEYRENFALSKVTWFRVGGLADVLFKPENEADLAGFLQKTPSEIPVFILGVGSNLLVRDGGIRGVVIRLGRGFTDIKLLPDNHIFVGAGCLNANLATFCQMNGVGGLEFLSGIPGTIGGAVAMNAGAYETETKDVLVSAMAADRAGDVKQINNADFGYKYRKHSLEGLHFFTSAIFKYNAVSSEEVAANMAKIKEAREASQPIRGQTGGSTFVNPAGQKAWQLIDEAGCRGLTIGGAQCSEKHCNFLLNIGDATAADIENLGEEIRRRVKETSGVELKWEVRIVGEKL
jgi:UDP-N-acetylmuramate dehydrogenase